MAPESRIQRISFKRRELCALRRWNEEYLLAKGVKIKNYNDTQSLVYFINLVRQISDLSITHVLLNDRVHKREFDRGVPFKDDRLFNHGQLYFILCDSDGARSITFVDQDYENGICYQFQVVTTVRRKELHQRKTDWVMDSLTDKPNSMRYIKEEAFLDGQKFKMAVLACLYHDIDYLLHEGFRLKDIGRSLRRNVQTYAYDNAYFERILQVEVAFSSLYRTPEQIRLSNERNEKILLATVGTFPFCCITLNKRKSCQKNIKYDIIHDRIPRNGIVCLRDVYIPNVFPLRPDPIFTGEDYVFPANVKRECEETSTADANHLTAEEKDRRYAVEVGFSPNLTYEEMLAFSPTNDDEPNNEENSSSDETVIERRQDNSQTTPPPPPNEELPPLPLSTPPPTPPPSRASSQSPGRRYKQQTARKSTTPPHPQAPPPPPIRRQDQTFNYQNRYKQWNKGYVQPYQQGSTSGYPSFRGAYQTTFTTPQRRNDRAEEGYYKSRESQREWEREERRGGMRGNNNSIPPIYGTRRNGYNVTSSNYRSYESPYPYRKWGPRYRGGNY